MDRLALAAANTLAGNELFAAGVEIGPFGAAFTAREGRSASRWRGFPQCRHRRPRRRIRLLVTLADGETLTLGFARGGSFSYLAIEGALRRADVR